MGGYVKNLVPGRSKKLEEYAVQIVPKAANAGSIRPGACNTLGCVMPAEHATVTTGHDNTRKSAFFEYFDGTRPLAFLGAMVLAGWQPPAWGQLVGKGPVAASLTAIMNTGIEMHLLDKAIDKVFRLDDNTKPESIRLHTGSLRPAVHIAFATLIMHHADRLREGEMVAVHLSLEQHILGVFKPTEPARQVLTRWGSIIRAQFEQDRLHSNPNPLPYPTLT